MMSGYFGDPAATLMAFDEEGFLRTGDLGSLDCDGYLKVTGRIKEMLIRGGENIYPREIEDALSEFPGVAEAAVVGIPSKKWGEEVAAAIRFFPGQDVEIEVIRAFLENRLARHKIPSRWNVVQDFPRSSLGKIQKYEIAKSFE